MACADMECSLRVHSRCECCVMKVHDVLRSIRGVYSVEWDVEKHLFTVSGEVDPSILLKAALRTGEHAEMVTVKIKHPQLRQRYYNHGPYGPMNPGYNMPYQRSMGNFPYYEANGYYNPYTLPRCHYGPPLVEYPSSYGCNHGYNHINATTSECIHPLPRASYVPSYPYKEYDTYDNFDSISPCTIM
ncbi:uncharacterized protein LOC143618689 [Bidens hawaiensis]|uniref:uncharacterized protein LOC143618689 n=1 Tax=Bidens hawaiensis TaxID=980011 RepID=UPI004049376B